MKYCQCKRCGKRYKLNKNGSFSKWAIQHTCNQNTFTKLASYFKSEDLFSRFEIIEEDKDTEYIELKAEIQELKSLIKNIKVSAPPRRLNPPPGINKENKWNEARKNNKRQKETDEKILAFGKVVDELTENFQKAKGDLRSILKKVPKKELNKPRPKTDHASFKDFVRDKKGEVITIEEEK